MTIHGVPGPGGSLGCCGVCGENFMKETILDLAGMEGGKVKSIHVEGLDGDICVHADCYQHLERGRDEGWETLPEGPLRRAFADAVRRKYKEVQAGMHRINRMSPQRIRAIPLGGT